MLHAVMLPRRYRWPVRSGRKKSRHRGEAMTACFWLRTGLYRRTPTRLTPPLALPPALWRTAARATGRGASTTPARATQPAGYAVYWQYTTALAGAGLRVRPARPDRALTAMPATLADLIERRFFGCMADLLLGPAERCTGAPSRMRLHRQRLRQRMGDIDIDQPSVCLAARELRDADAAHDLGAAPAAAA